MIQPRYLVLWTALSVLAPSCKSPNPASSRVASVTVGPVETAYRNLLARQTNAVPVGRPAPALDRRQPLLPQLQTINSFVKEQIPETAPLYAADAGVSERLSIDTHTSRVLSVLADQMEFFPEFPKASLAGEALDLDKMLAYAVAAHDLGKGVAVERAEGTHSQHEYVPKAVEAVLTLVGLSPAEVRIGATMMGDDLVGETIQRYSAQRAEAVTRELAEQAASCELTARDYWNLRQLFLVADATSYEVVRRNYFQMTDDKGVKSRFPSRFDRSEDQLREVPPSHQRLVSTSGNLEAMGDMIAALAPERAGATAASPDDRGAEEERWTPPKNSDGNERSRSGGVAR